MTKKKSIKNREWEKDRRDRLNKCFDSLAKLLPQYNVSSPLSKIEILQRAIVYVENLKKKVAELLDGNNTSILKSQEDLEEGFKVLLIRNSNLLDLLRNASIAVPPFNVPKLFDNIVITTHEQISENNCNELNIKSFERPLKYSNKISKQPSEETKNSNNVKNSTKEKKNKIVKKLKLDAVNNDLKSMKDINCTEAVHSISKSSVATTDSNIFKNSNTSSCADNIRTTCAQEKATISSNGMLCIEKIGSTASDKNVNNTTTTHTTISTPIMTTGVILQNDNVIKLPFIIPQQMGQPLLLVKNLKKDQTQKLKTLRQAIPGKVAIPAIKNTNFKLKPKKVRRKKKKIEEDKQTDNKKELAKINPLTGVKRKHSDIIENKESKISKTLNEVGDHIVSHKPEEAKEQPLRIFNEVYGMKTNLTNLKSDKDRKMHESVPESQGTLSQPELSNEIFDSLHVPQTESHTESLSPTAAFLLSFPVVSLAAGKLCETDPIETCASNQIQNDDQSLKDKHQNDHNLLDNISSLLMTKDYDKFVEDVVKTEQNIPKFQMLPYSTGSSITKREKFMQTYDSQEATFDFHLKPIISNYHNNIPMSSSLFTPDVEGNKSISTSTTQSAYCNNGSLNSTPKISINSTRCRTDLVDSKTNSNLMYPFLPPKPAVCMHSESILSRCTLSEANHEEPSVTKLNPIFTFSLTNTSATNTTLVSSKTNQNLGFYDSLSAIGTSQQNYSSTISKPLLTSSNVNMTNLYTNVLSLSSTSAINSIETTNYVPQTPFTFSLTNPSTSQYKVSTNIPLSATTSVYTSSLANFDKSKSNQSFVSGSILPETFLPTTPSTYSNTFNPFSFDNIPMNSNTITSASTKDTSNFSFSLSSTISTSTTITSTATSTSNTLNPFSIEYNILTDTKLRQSHVPFSSSDNTTSQRIPLLNDKTFNQKMPSKIPNYMQQDTLISAKPTKTNQKPHVNWMTSTDDFKHNEFPNIPPNSFTQTPVNTTYYTPQIMNLDINRKSDVFFAHPPGEDNFPWSPNKMLDAPMLNTLTLPNLHGDLALNTISNNSSKSHVSNILDMKKETYNKNAQVQSSSNLLDSQINNGNQGNLFSVRQMVDQRKTSQNNTAAYDETNQKSPKQVNQNIAKNKYRESKKSVMKSSSNQNYSSNIFVDSFAYNESTKQNISNNYSAEALISQIPNKKDKSHINFTANDYYNVLETPNTIFPNIDYAGDTNFNIYNSNYLSQNTVSHTECDYLGASSYADPYISKQGRSQQQHVYPFPPANKLPPTNQQMKLNSQLQNPSNRSYSTNKKVHKQDIYSIQPPPPIPSYDSIGANTYFSAPLTVNSPILPLSLPPPPTLSNEDYHLMPINYPGNFKNVPYSQQMPENQLIIPIHSHSSGNNSNLVSNFNLSTICPEINDKSKIDVHENISNICSSQFTGQVPAI